MFPRNKLISFIHKFKNVKDYSFIHILTPSDVTKNENKLQNIKDSNFLMINQYLERKENKKEKPHTYIIIGFKKTIVKIEKSLFSLFQPLLSFNRNINIYFLTKIDGINIDENFRIFDNNDDIFTTEIDNFNKELFLSHSNDLELQKIWQFIKPCISGYLIKESYEKTKIDRLNNIINFEKGKEKLLEATSILSKNTTIPSTKESFNEIPIIIKEEEIIELRDIGPGFNFKTVLIYHIEREELYAEKKQQGISPEIEKLKEREIELYSKVQHPLIPKLIGIGPNKEYLIIEFINGRTLLEINEVQLNFNEKITIFFELMIIIEFLHRKGFVYRDLKPNNIIIDENKTAILIDFDRMIEEKMH